MPRMDVPTLHGELVTLRPARRDDLDRLREILLQPGVARWWGGPRDDPDFDVATDWLAGDGPTRSSSSRSTAGRSGASSSGRSWSLTTGTARSTSSSTLTTRAAGSGRTRSGRSRATSSTYSATTRSFGRRPADHNRGHGRRSAEEGDRSGDARRRHGRDGLLNQQPNDATNEARGNPGLFLFCRWGRTFQASTVILAENSDLPLGAIQMYRWFPSILPVPQSSSSENSIRPNFRHNATVHPTPRVLGSSRLIDLNSATKGGQDEI